ncbi:MAG: sugar transferase [Actinomycetota bacterium]|nr:sugar transferase [Actinomycetota bacterium]
MDSAIPSRSALSRATAVLSRAQAIHEDRTRSRVLLAYRRVGRLMAATDGLAICAAFLFAYQIRFGFEPPDLPFLLTMAAALPVWVALFAGYHLYAVQHLSTSEEFKRILSAVSVGTMLVVAVSFWTKASFSREWMALVWGMSLVFLLVTRTAWHRRIRQARRDGELTRRTLIVGTNSEAEALAEAMEVEASGFELVGHLETAASTPGMDSVPTVGELSELEDVVRATRSDCLFVASSAVRVEDMRRLGKLARQTGIDVRVSANLPEVMAGRVAVQPFGGLTALSIRPVALSRPKAAVKRAFDLAVSSLAVALTSPLLLAIAAAVKLTSRGPVLYRQIRVGRYGKPFTVYKFRTMVSGAEEALDELRALNEATGPLFKIRHDPRVTRVGALLRKWSLDELPQLINVVRGEMSLVGPRPPLPEEVEAYDQDWFFDRLEVLPGITGLWQVSGRSNLSFEDYIKLDLNYVENWSLAFDLFILLKTVPALLSRSGAY